MKITEAMSIRSNYSGKLSGFMDELYDLTEEHPFNRATRLYGNTSIEVTPFGNEIHISDIRSMSPRSGAGTKTMKMLTDLADKHRVVLGMRVSAYSNDTKHITDLEKLVKWYMKMRFRITDELTDDPDDLEGLDSVEMKYFPR